MMLTQPLLFKPFSSFELNLRLTALVHIKPVFHFFNIYFHIFSALCFCLYLLWELCDADYCYCTYVYSVFYRGPQGRTAHKLIVLHSQNNV